MLNRRTTLTALLATAGLAAMPLPAIALSEVEAKTLIETVIEDINAVINSGKSESAMIKDFEKIFRRYGDVPIMARYALGVDARRATSGQLKSFTAVFQQYISRKYGKRFREFIGADIKFKSSRKIKSGYEIRTIAQLRGTSPFEVTFLVSDKSGKELFFNMFIEGVNLLLTERTEIGAMLDQRKGNLDQLIADLKNAG